MNRNQDLSGVARRRLLAGITRHKSSLAFGYAGPKLDIIPHQMDVASQVLRMPQPRALLRVVNPEKTDEGVAYGEWGRVELTTLTKEFFMPRFLERDEAIRRKPCDKYPWDGVGDVRPFGALEKKVIEGVY